MGGQTRFQQMAVDWERSMEGDELTEDELESLLPDNFLDDLKECEPDAEALAKLDELEAFDRFERILADEPARVSTFVSWPPASLPSRLKRRRLHQAKLAQQFASPISPKEFNCGALRGKLEDFCQAASDRNFYTTQSRRIARPADVPRPARRPLRMKCLCS